MTDNNDWWDKITMNKVPIPIEEKITPIFTSSDSQTETQQPNSSLMTPMNEMEQHGMDQSEMDSSVESDIDIQVLSQLPPSLQQEILAELSLEQQEILQSLIASKKEDVVEKWQCTSCTFANHPDLPFCEMCNTIRSLVSSKDIWGNKAAVAKQLLTKSLARISKLAKNPSQGPSSLLKSASKKFQSVKADAVEKIQYVKTEASDRFQRLTLNIPKGKTAPKENQICRKPSKSCLKELHVLRESLKTVCTPGDEMYETLIQRLWDAVFNYDLNQDMKRTLSRDGDGWLEMGFQRSNPDTDFRGGGLLALKCLVYQFEVHHEKMKGIMVQQTPKTGNNTYPLCTAGINLTFMLAGVLKLGDGSYAEQEEVFWNLFEEPSAFYEIHSIAVVIMDQIWYEFDASYMSFSEVLHATRQRILFILQKGPHTMEDVHKIAKYMKCQPSHSMSRENSTDSDASVNSSSALLVEDKNKSYDLLGLDDN